VTVEWVSIGKSSQSVCNPHSTIDALPINNPLDQLSVLLCLVHFPQLPAQENPKHISGR
jgi:hypothetical protein